MSLELVDILIRWLGGLLTYTTLGVLFYCIWRGAHRQAGRTTGRTGSWLRSPWFYLVSSALFFGLCTFGWDFLDSPFIPLYTKNVSPLSK